MALGALLMLAGTTLAIGLFNRVSSVIAGGAVVYIALSGPPWPTPNLFDGAFPDLLMLAMAGALGLIGPGAWSVDARMFGYRQIIIGRK